MKLVSEPVIGVVVLFAEFVMPVPEADVVAFALAEKFREGEAVAVGPTRVELAVIEGVKEAPVDSGPTVAELALPVMGAETTSVLPLQIVVNVVKLVSEPVMGVVVLFAEFVMPVPDAVVVAFALYGGTVPETEAVAFALFDGTPVPEAVAVAFALFDGIPVPEAVPVAFALFEGIPVPEAVPVALTLLDAVSDAPVERGPTVALPVMGAETTSVLPLQIVVKVVKLVSDPVMAVVLFAEFVIPVPEAVVVAFALYEGVPEIAVPVPTRELEFADLDGVAETPVPVKLGSVALAVFDGVADTPVPVPLKNVEFAVVDAPVDSGPTVAEVALLVIGWLTVSTVPLQVVTKVVYDVSLPVIGVVELFPAVVALTEMDGEAEMPVLLPPVGPTTVEFRLGDAEPEALVPVGPTTVEFRLGEGEAEMLDPVGPTTVELRLDDGEAETPVPEAGAEDVPFRLGEEVAVIGWLTVSTVPLHVVTKVVNEVSLPVIGDVGVLVVEPVPVGPDELVLLLPLNEAEELDEAGAVPEEVEPVPDRLDELVLFVPLTGVDEEPTKVLDVTGAVPDEAGTVPEEDAVPERLDELVLLVPLTGLEDEPTEELDETGAVPEDNGTVAEEEDAVPERLDELVLFVPLTGVEDEPREEEADETGVVPDDEGDPVPVGPVELVE